MIAELGHFFLTLAFATALFQCVVPQWGAKRGNSALMLAAEPAALTQFALIAAAFFCLIWLYVTSDFSVQNVAENSHTTKPLIYKISGVWGNHEGSMVLWVFILALFGATVAAFGSNLPLGLRARTLSVQALVGALFLLFILTVSNPFLRLATPPIEGAGLNPILQDPSLAIHPPFLYAGYVGLSVAFSFSCAALIDGKIDPAWARWVRPWTLVAWMFLTAGIALGSFWAYYELGWGGFWFWDPVENASFMPWLVATALLHSSIVVEKRNALKIWTVLLSILAFSLSLVGTFLVRSGVLTSVHAFAIDPARGVFILAILTLLIGGALTLFAWRAREIVPGGIFAPISREGALVFNNLILACCAATVFIGTLYPLALDAVADTKISVGAPYYNLTFVPMIVPLLLLVPAGPMLSWKRAEAWPVLQRLWAAALIAATAALVSYSVTQGVSLLAPLGLAMGFWLVAGSLLEFAQRIGLPGSMVLAARRLRGLPRSSLGMTLAHAGLGIAVLGIVAVTAWRQELITVVKQGEKVGIAGYDVMFAGEFRHEGANFTAESGQFNVSKHGVNVATLISEKRTYRPQNETTSEAAIQTFIGGDLYLVMGDVADGGGRVVRIYFNPFVRFIWLGAAIMFAGGILSLSDRRFRVGAPVRSALAKPAE